MKNFAPSAQSNRQLILGWPLLFVLFLVTGCGNSGGDSGSNSGPTAEYKVVNALTNSSAVSVSMDGKVVGTNLSYPDAVGPLVASAGSHSLAVNQGSTVLAQGNFALSAGTQSTFLFTWSGQLSDALFQLTDDTTPAANSQGKLRVVIDALVDPIPDIYIEQAGKSPSGNPTFGNIPYAPYATTYQTLSPANYVVFFTDPGTTQLVYQTAPIMLASNQNRTVVLVDDCDTVCSGYASVIVADLN